MMRYLLIFLFAWSAQAQLTLQRATYPPLLQQTVAAASSTCTNQMTFTSAASFGNTSNFDSYITSAFTPNSNDLIILFAAFSPPNISPTVTNTGGTQYTWWRAGVTNYNTLASPAHTVGAWVTQVPVGANPFSMQVALLNTGGTGANMSVVTVTGADTNTAWGTNAIAQNSVIASNSTANPQVSITPYGSQLNAILLGVGDSINSAADNAASTSMFELSETAYNTPAAGLAVYSLPMAGGITGVTNTATSRNWGGIALEIRAGTTNCYTEPAFSGKTFYVNTDSTAGGDGTTTNTTGATRAFASLREAIRSASLHTSDARRIQCMGSAEDVTNVIQGDWDTIDSTPANYILIEGDNTTGKWNNSAYRISMTNFNCIYNNNPGHVRIKNFQINLRATTSGAVSSYTAYRLATQNVGAGRTDCDVRFINCIAQTSATGSDDVFGWYDSDFAVNDLRNTCRRINCLSYSTNGVAGNFIYGFGDANTACTLINYNCTAVNCDFDFDAGSATTVNINCLGGTTLGGNQCFLTSTPGKGFTHNNASADGTAIGLGARVSQTFTFVSASTYDFHLSSSDAGAKNFGFPNPTYNLVLFDIDGVTVSGAWSIGADDP